MNMTVKTAWNDFWIIVFSRRVWNTSNNFNGRRNKSKNAKFTKMPSTETEENKMHLIVLRRKRFWFEQKSLDSPKDMSINSNVVDKGPFPTHVLIIALKTIYIDENVT